MTSSPGSLPKPARSRRWSWARWILVGGAVVYVLFGLFIYSRQTSLIYEGSVIPIPRDDAFRQAKAVHLVPWERTTPGASGPQGYVSPDFASPAPRGTIVYFHGNGETAWEWSGAKVAPFTRRGFRVFLYEYPGYGGRPGTPSERTIVADARAVIRSLADAGFGPLYVWGNSLGAGIAPAVCADSTLPVEGLTLVTPWDSLPNVAASYYPYLPVRFFITDRYDSIVNLQNFHHPICVIRGDLDDTIPPALTVHLFTHLPNPRKMILMTGFGHGDWPSSPEAPWWDDALDFIASRHVTPGPTNTGGHSK